MSTKMNKSSLFLLLFIQILNVKSDRFQPINLADVKHLEFAYNQQTTGYNQRPQLKCRSKNQLTDQNYCGYYKALFISCLKKLNSKAPNVLDTANWNCTSMFTSNYMPFKMEIAEMQIECENFKNQNLDHSRIIVNGSCYLEYSLRKVTKLNDFDKYLIAKATAYCLFSFLFLVVCCIIGYKNKRAQELTDQQNQLVNVFCLNNPTFIRSSDSNRSETEDLPPLYSELFNSNEPNENRNISNGNESVQNDQNQNVQNDQNQNVQNDQNQNARNEQNQNVQNDQNRNARNEQNRNA